MIIHDLTGSERHPVYQQFEAANLERQFTFLHSLVDASIRLGRPYLSTSIIRALNCQAIVSLHDEAGQYRSCNVRIGELETPPPHRVPALVDDLVNWVNRYWHVTDGITLATFVLWRLAQIHPFVNGNGRTARAVCYYILCVKFGGWLPGHPILPDLLKRHRDEYIAALRHADRMEADPARTGSPTERLERLVRRLLAEQAASVSDEED